MEEEESSTIEFNVPGVNRVRAGRVLLCCWFNSGFLFPQSANANRPQGLNLGADCSYAGPGARTLLPLSHYLTLHIFECLHQAGNDWIVESLLQNRDGRIVVPPLLFGAGVESAP